MVAHEIRGSGSKNQWCGQRDSTQKWWQAAGVLSRPRKCLLMTGAKMSQQIQDTAAPAPVRAHAGKKAFATLSHNSRLGLAGSMLQLPC